MTSGYQIVPTLVVFLRRIDDIVLSLDEVFRATCQPLEKEAA
jgi:hypothetical protein